MSAPRIPKQPRAMLTPGQVAWCLLGALVASGLVMIVVMVVAALFRLLSWMVWVPPA
jgi:hypothetical protein